MKTFLHLVWILAITCIAMAPGFATADCNLTTSLVPTIPRLHSDYASAPNNTRISPWSLTSGIAVQCATPYDDKGTDNTDNYKWALMVYLNGGPQTPDLFYDGNIGYPIIPTGITGLGLLVGMRDTKCDLGWRALKNTASPPHTPPSTLPFSVNDVCEFVFKPNDSLAGTNSGFFMSPKPHLDLTASFSMQIAFVKTGEIPSLTNGATSNITIGGFFYQQQINGEWSYKISQTSNTAININLASIIPLPECNITLPGSGGHGRDGHVTLPDRSQYLMADVGSTTGTTPFEITIKCDNAVSVIDSFRFTTNSTNEWWIPNKIDDDDYYAKGVAVRLLDYDGTPIRLNYNKKPGGDTGNFLPLDSGKKGVTLNFSAEYYRTGSGDSSSPYTAGFVEVQTIFDIDYH